MATSDLPEPLLAALRAVTDPNTGQDFVSTKALKSLRLEGGKLSFDVEMGYPARSQWPALRQAFTAAARAVPGVSEVAVHISTRVTAHAVQRGVQLLPNVRNIVAVASGKGGVGKSSVTTNLAVALANAGHSVGIVDADIYGFSIPRMLGADRDPVVIDQMLVPPEAWGVRCISIGYFVPDGQAVIWRGPMLHKALEQFLTDVFWDEPDYLLIDMPPGTGDIALSLSQYLPKGEVLVVTTPQEAAQKVARLSAAMAKKVNLPVRGVIENMSWFTGDDGKRYELFGSGGGAELAAELDVPLLAQIPLTPVLREGGDAGNPIAAAHPDSEAGRAFHHLAEQIEKMRPKKLFSKGLKLLS